MIESESDRSMMTENPIMSPLENELDAAGTLCATMAYNLQEDVCAVPTDMYSQRTGSKSTVNKV